MAVAFPVEFDGGGMPGENGQMDNFGKNRKALAAAAALIAVFAAELWLSARDKSPTFDEPAHIYAGYSYWTRSDFGMNPEHPPLVKLIAALPLLPLQLKVPPVPDAFFRIAPYFGGYELLFANDAGKLLGRARTAAGVFAFLLAALVFACGTEMFGIEAGLLSLAILVFEPNILGNGPLVATDIGVTCCLFAAIYAFYRYVKRPSAARLVLSGVAAGLALSTKHSGLLVFPMLILLAAVEVFADHKTKVQARGADGGASNRSPMPLMRMAGALAAIALMAWLILWSCYGFRFRARPSGLSLNPPTAEYLRNVHEPFERSAIAGLARWHVLPEAYLFGLADIMIQTQQGRSAFLFGKLYPRGRWFYFPAALLIKCTIGFLCLLLLVPFTGILRRQDTSREILFLSIPATFYFALSLASRLDVGIRHILPIFPLLIILAAAGASSLMKQGRAWAVVVTALLVLHAASSLRVFPAYLAYSNEIWGGPAETYKVLADSNLGWGSGLEATERFIQKRGIKDCWLAYAGTGDPEYYMIPCRPLPTFTSRLFGYGSQPVPPEISGPVFVSASLLSGIWSGPGSQNPYEQFNQARPVAVLRGEILVYEGRFSVLGLGGNQGR